VTNAELAFDAVVQAKAELKAKAEWIGNATLHVAELNSVVKIIVHCDLGSGMQGHLSVTCR
jgi:hypothetical protein